MCAVDTTTNVNAIYCNFITKATTTIYTPLITAHGGCLISLPDVGY